MDLRLSHNIQYFLKQTTRKISHVFIFKGITEPNMFTTLHPTTSRREKEERSHRGLESGPNGDLPNSARRNVGAELLDISVKCVYCLLIRYYIATQRPILLGERHRLTINQSISIYFRHKPIANVNPHPKKEKKTTSFIKQQFIATTQFDVQINVLLPQLH